MDWWMNILCNMIILKALASLAMLVSQDILNKHHIYSQPLIIVDCVSSLEFVRDLSIPFT
jgi:hypothetical protein